MGHVLVISIRFESFWNHHFLARCLLWYCYRWLFGDACHERPSEVVWPPYSAVSSMRWEFPTAFIRSLFWTLARSRHVSWLQHVFDEFVLSHPRWWLDVHGECRHDPVKTSICAMCRPWIAFIPCIMKFLVSVYTSMVSRCGYMLEGNTKPSLLHFADRLITFFKESVRAGVPPRKGHIFLYRRFGLGVCSICTIILLHRSDVQSQRV